jgi:hypothetical protein
VTGQVIPEAVFSFAAYHELLQRIYRDIAPHDPDGVLQDEWLNARGAIARFDRGAIEIRVLDTQECPEQDLAVAAFVTSLVEATYKQTFCSLVEQKQVTTELLAAQFHSAVQWGGAAPVLADYARCFRSNAQTLGSPSYWTGFCLTTLHFKERST